MARVLIGNFKGPKGDKGDQGAAGPKGEQGIQGNTGPAGGVDSVNGVQGDVILGGRNLVLNSSPITSLQGWTPIRGIGVMADIDGKKAYKYTADDSNGLRHVTVIASYPDTDENVVSISGYIYFPPEEFSDSMFGSIYVSHVPEGVPFYQKNIAIKPGWNYVTATTPEAVKRKSPNTGIYWDFYMRDNDQASLAGKSMYIYHPAISEGSVPILWSPAPEDYLGPVNIYKVPQMHRNIFRGQNLGSTFTDAQKSAIAAGTFDDLYVGDYWVMNGHTWRIVDIDYWYGLGDPACTTHHVVVMPDAPLYNSQMRKTDSGEYEAGSVANSTEGGYALSDMRQTGLDQAKTIVTTDFGTNVLNHRIVISNAVKDGHDAGFLWADSTVDLPTEWQMYGAPVFTPMNNGVNTPQLYTIDQKQFALMQAVHQFINYKHQTAWLRNVISESSFAAVATNGGATSLYASYVRGVRPAFGVAGI